MMHLHWYSILHLSWIGIIIWLIHQAPASTRVKDRLWQVSSSWRAKIHSCCSPNSYLLLPHIPDCLWLCLKWRKTSTFSCPSAAHPNGVPAVISVCYSADSRIQHKFPICMTVLFLSFEVAYAYGFMPTLPSCWRSLWAVMLFYSNDTHD